MEKQTRDRKCPIKVYVSPDERQEIVKRSTATRLSPSTYLRNVGLGYEPQAVFDREAIQELIKLHADQGRLGGLLKLWLSEKPGEGARQKEVRSVLNQIESLQQQLARIVMDKAVKTR